ncbi:MAG TPA: plastocyanin/azurin family copper-binding protein [Vicinamibacterales bacterium]|nr:plastocyanin/azurin family copper-binding protein [Vicinamibacterales bacterium]
MTSEATAEVLLLAVVCGAGFACAAQPGAPRDIVLVARGMTFVLEDAPDVPNPVIPMRAGERVRLVLKNEAPGLLHDLVIPDFGIEIERMRAGETRELIFTVPAAPGRYEYRCLPHAEMMHGFVEVAP